LVTICQRPPSGPATAQQTGGPLYDTKVFYPKTGSYYEMVRSTPGYSIRGNNPEISWSRAAQRAGGSSFKGFKGRLAVVRTPDVNRFLMETFRPNQAVWIGLRYWCSFNKLQWIDGKFHDRSDWANWDAGWNHAGGRARVDAERELGHDAPIPVPSCRSGCQHAVKEKQGLRSPQAVQKTCFVIVEHTIRQT